MPLRFLVHTASIFVGAAPIFGGATPIFIAQKSERRGLNRSGVHFCARRSDFRMYLMRRPFVPLRLSTILTIHCVSPTIKIIKVFLIWAYLLYHKNQYVDIQLSHIMLDNKKKLLVFSITFLPIILPIASSQS